MRGMVPILARRRQLQTHAAFDPTASAPFTPASLSGLIGWWKSDTGVFKDAGVTPAANGDTVNQWNDQSGNGNNLKPQVTEAIGPIFNTSILNGLPALTFVFTSHMTLGLASVSLGGTTASAFMVAKVAPTSASDGRLLVFQATGQANDFDNTSSALFLDAQSTTAVRAFRNNGSLSNGTIVNNVFLQLGSIYDGANNTVYLGGTGQTPVASTGTFGATGQLVLGAFMQGGVNVTNGVDGSICEVVLTNTALNSTDRSNINTYFLNKYTV